MSLLIYQETTNSYLTLQQVVEVSVHAGVTSLSPTAVTLATTQQQTLVEESLPALAPKLSGAKILLKITLLTLVEEFICGTVPLIFLGEIILF